MLVIFYLSVCPQPAPPVWCPPTLPHTFCLLRPAFLCCCLVAFCGKCPAVFHFCLQPPTIQRFLQVPFDMAAFFGHYTTSFLLLLTWHATLHWHDNHEQLGDICVVVEDRAIPHSFTWPLYLYSATTYVWTEVMCVGTPTLAVPRQTTSVCIYVLAWLAPAYYLPSLPPSPFSLRCPRFGSLQNHLGMENRTGLDRQGWSMVVHGLCWAWVGPGMTSNSHVPSMVMSPSLLP